MTRCQQWQERCSARVDGELSSGEQAALTAHLDSCGACRAHMQQMEMVHRAMGKLERRVPVPSALAARIESAALRGQGGYWHRSQRRPWIRTVSGALIAASLALAVWSQLGPHESRRLPDLCTVLVEDHLRYLPVPVPDASDIHSAQPTQVEQWFGERLDFDFPVPVLADAHLVGGRLCFIDGRRVGLLFYEHGSTRISVFVLPDARLGGLHKSADGTWSGGMHGYHVRAIRAEGVTYAMVSDLPEETMAQLFHAGVQDSNQPE